MANLSNINNKFLVTTGGDVGVGITSPVEKLDTLNIAIGGATITSYSPNKLRIDNNGGNSRFYSTGANTTTTGSYQIHVTSSDGSINNPALTIASNTNSTFAGNVGIGAAASDGNLHVRKTGINTGITNVLMNANFADGSNGTGLSIGYRTDETTAVLAPRTATGNLAFYSYDGGWSESMRIQNNGNVGIGTNVANDINEGKLCVNGTLVLDQTSEIKYGKNNGGPYLNIRSKDGTTSACGIRIHSPAGSPGYLYGEGSGTSGTSIMILDGAGQSVFSATQGNNTQIRVNNQTHLYINNSGRVGIGTTLPKTTLDITGSGNTAINSKGNLVVSSGGTAAQAAETGGQISFGSWLNGDLSQPYPLAAIRGVAESSTSNNNRGALIFGTMDSNTAVQERMRIASSGWVSVVTKPNSGLNYNVAIWVGDVLGYQTTLQLSDILAYSANKLSPYNGITFADGTEATTSGGTVIPAPGRSTSPAPQDYQRSFSTEFKGKSASGNPGVTGSWAGLISMAPYNPSISGFYATQIAFGGDGTGDGMFTRRGTTTTWGAWREFVIEDTSGNISPSGVYLGGTAAANLLNHYEQGTYQPILRAVSGSVATMFLQNGYWTRIGNVVTVGGTLTWSANGSNANSYTVITMPFSNTGSTNARAAGTLGAVQGIANGATLRLVIDPGQNQAYVIQQNSTSYSHTNNISASGAIYGFSITYRLT